MNKKTAQISVTITEVDLLIQGLEGVPNYAERSGLFQKLDDARRELFNSREDDDE